MTDYEDLARRAVGLLRKRRRVCVGCDTPIHSRCTGCGNSWLLGCEEDCELAAILRDAEEAGLLEGE